MNILKFSLFVIALFLAIGCRNSTFGEVEPYKTQAVLSFTFNNPDGNSPTIVIDNEASTPNIRFDLSQGNITGVVNGRAFANFSNIRFLDELGIYRILNIQTQEQRNEEWVTEYSSYLRETPTQTAAFVLVLDVSSSLGSDFVKVQQFAKNYIMRVQVERPSLPTAFGIVAFADTTTILPITTDTAQAFAFISNLTTGVNTRLYEAIYQGASLLNSYAADSKTLFVFTDGRNNSWSDNLFASPDAVTQYLLQPTLNGVRISSYMLGYTGKGGVDETVLAGMTSPEALFSFPPEFQDVGRSFNRFADAAATLYNLYYDRDAAPVNNLKVRVALELELF